MLTRKLRVPGHVAARLPTMAIAAAMAIAAGVAGAIGEHLFQRARNAPDAGRASAGQHPPAAAGAASSDEAVDPQLAQFRRFALNGLLADLLDDSQPPRWTTASLSFLCSGPTTVTVDGRPLRSGAPVPARPFVLRWQMDACRPFGEAAVLLSGEVELTVYPKPAQMRAVVDARALLAFNADGVARRAGLFTASLALGPNTPP